MSEQKTITISIKKILVPLGILVLLFIIFSVLFNVFGRSYGLSIDSNEMATIRLDSSSGSSGVTDTREFMKVSYSGNIRTRKVKDVTRNTKSIIREMEGRVDFENQTEKYARIDFVIPKSNFENFRDEIESLTHAKLYTENSSSRNLLSEKQAIEQSEKSVNELISGVQKEKVDLENNHKKTITSLQSQLKTATDNANNTQKLLRQVESVPTDPQDLTRFDQINALNNSYNNYVNQSNILRGRISEENNSYTIKKNELDAKLQQLSGQLDQVKTNDKNFNENIETVEGSVSINWISIWELGKVFSPVHPTIIILILVVVFWYILKKMRIAPLIVFKW